jgi:hypothetical protein
VVYRWRTAVPRGLRVRVVAVVSSPTSAQGLVSARRTVRGR